MDVAIVLILITFASTVVATLWEGHRRTKLIIVALAAVSSASAITTGRRSRASGRDRAARTQEKLSSARQQGSIHGWRSTRASTLVNVAERFQLLLFGGIQTF